MPSKKDLIHMALTHAGIIGVGETISGEDYAVAEQTADGLFAELKLDNGVPLAWDLDSVPPEVFLSLYTLLSVDLSPVFSVAPRANRGAIWGRLRGIINKQADLGLYDINKDGVVDENESNAKKRAEFF